jgi:rSAM/selenodomain-associated transferase 2
MEEACIEPAMTSETELSIIIPTLNEAELLPTTLESIFQQKASGFEVIVVDAGSEDATTAIAVARGAQVIHTRIAQRAHQMNLGAAQARGRSLIFLHADSCLPSTGLAAIKRALRDHTTIGGAFIRRFNHPSVFLRITCMLADLRGYVLGWHLGDQGIFIRRLQFQQLGGFPDWGIFEDLELSRRMSRHGVVVTLRPAIRTSGRRFGNHPIKQTFRDVVLTIQHFLDRN